jgi:hypothetical protein
MKRQSWLFVAVVVSACNSGSGVTGSKKLIELSASEQDKLCGYIADLEHGYIATCIAGMPDGIPTDRPCGDIGIPGYLGDLGSKCAATVDDAENCYEARAKDPCHYDFNASCGALYVCFLYRGQP